MKTFRLYLISIILLIIVSSLFSQEQMQDVVYLKNGSVIRGIIIEQIPNKSIKIQTKDANIFVYSLEEIQKITKETPVRIESVSMSSGIFGVRGYLGLDLDGNFGFGGGASYIYIPTPGGINYEFSLDYLYNKSIKNNASEGTSEVTEVNLIIVKANWLFNYQARQNGLYFLTGIGLVGGSIEWSEINGLNGTGNNSNDISYSGIGNVVNFGIGYTTKMGLEPRLETPLLFFYNAGNAAAFVPTITFGI